MVQLKLPANKKGKQPLIFQFHNGTIKTTRKQKGQTTLDISIP